MSSIIQLFQTFNWRTPSWDLFILGAWLIVALVYTFAAGRGRVVNILISTYLAELIIIKVPFLDSGFIQKINLSSTLVSFERLIVFLIVFLLLFLLLGRFVFRTSADSHKVSAVLFSFIFSILQIGLLINIVLSNLPIAVQQTFSQPMQALFLKNPAPLIWLLLPLVYLIALGKHISEDDEI